MFNNFNGNEISKPLENYYPDEEKRKYNYKKAIKIVLITLKIRNLL